MLVWFFHFKEASISAIIAYISSRIGHRSIFLKHRKIETTKDNLLNYIKRYVSISDKEYALFLSYLHTKKIKKKAYLLQEGKLCKSRYYIRKGCVRLYYIDSKANEQIVHFGIDDWWITDYESLVNKVPSKLYIQATEDTELYELSQENFEKMCLKLPLVDKLFRKIMEKTYIAFQKRMEYMFSMSGEELYREFIYQNPTFAQRVPQYMIASYLGMTPEFVSKIKAQKK